MIRFRCPRLSLISFAAVAFFAAAPQQSVADDKSGEIHFGTDRYVEYDTGDLPIVLTSPHGGRLSPDALPTRTEGVTDSDLNSQELARAIADELFVRTGHRTALVASQLHRRKLDPNRELAEAAQGNPAAEKAWNEFHSFIAAATKAAAAQHGFAFLVDIHGHAHPIARIELGYALSAPQLNQSDQAFDASGLIELSTFRDLHARLGGSAAGLLRGPRSLGDLFASRGIRAVPSPQDPQPGDNPFFAGGYIVRTYAAAPATTKVDGLQIETNRVGIRDTAENRAHFAKVAADVLTLFLHERYRYDFPVKK